MDDISSSYPVRLGVWTNWAHGRVMGSTLTLTRSDGALLIAFIAFFVTMTGTQLWRIVCFAVHSKLSTDSPQDALHNQRQVVLRNSTTPLGSIWILMQMMHAWKRGQKESNMQALVRLLPLCLGTLVVAVGLAAATGLSSRIAQGDNGVLIDGSRCSRFDFGDNLTAIALHRAPYEMRDITMGADYAQRCYESTSSSNECNTFARQSLPLIMTPNASCPFDSSMCLSQETNVIVDTGLMDSHADLGLNWPAKDRFQLQSKWHCAPLVTEGYKSNYAYENRTFVRYQYGDLMQMPSECDCTLAIPNGTLSDAIIGRNSPFMEPAVNFHLYSSSSLFFNGSVLETTINNPIPPLRKHKGDLNIIFLLGNSKTFLSKSEDLWYRASTPVKAMTELAVPISIYRPDEPAWPMGCVMQHQFCKAGRCTGLGSYMDVATSLREEFDDMDSSFFGPDSYLSLVQGPGSMIYSLGASALAATLKGATTLQYGPQKNDWHRDVKHWFATMLASMQFRLASIATGPNLRDSSVLSDFVKTAPANETQLFCHSQIIRSTEYTSFSMFWLMFVLVAGLLLALISVSLESTAAVLHKWLCQSDGYAPLEWRANHALHLQRLAHENYHHDTKGWIQSAWDIPVTMTDVTLPTVEEDQGLPRLRVGAEERSLEEGLDESGSLCNDEGVVADKAVPRVTVDGNRVSLSEDSRLAESDTSPIDASPDLGPNRDLP